MTDRPENLNPSCRALTNSCGELPPYIPLAPLIETIGDILNNILLPAFLILEPLFRKLGEAVQIVSDAIIYLLDVIASSWIQGLMGPGGAALNPATPVPSTPWDDFLKWLSGTGGGAAGKGISVGSPDAIYVIGPKLAGQIVSMGLAEIRA